MARGFLAPFLSTSRPAGSFPGNPTPGRGLKSRKVRALAHHGAGATASANACETSGKGSRTFSTHRYSRKLESG